MRIDLSLLRRSLCLVAITAIGILVVGCGGSSSSSESGSTSLTVRTPEDPVDLDPHTAESSASLEVTHYMYDTIVGATPAGRVVPELASRWTVTPAAITLSIRDDASCSDGSKVTPTLIKMNLDRFKDPRTKSPYVDSTMGSTDYVVTADDAAGTVTIKLPKPFSPLLSNLVRGPQIICKAGLDNPKGLKKASYGSGPFVMSQRVPGDHYTLTARKGYTWGPDGASTAVDGFPKQVTLRVVPNETTAANQLQSGELDLVSIDGPERERLAKVSGLVSKVVPRGVSVLHFNEAKGRPGADPAIRKALVEAFDRSAMTQDGYAQFGRVSPTTLVPQSECYSDEPGSSIPAFDSAAARSVIAKAAPSLKLYAIAVNGGQYLSETWGNLGAKVDLNQGDESGPGLDVVFGGGDWDAALIRWDRQTNVNTMQPYLSGPVPPDGTNVGSIENPEYVEQADAARATIGQASCTASNASQSALFSQSDIIPISLVTGGFFARKGVQFDTYFGYVIPTSLRTP